MNSTLLGFAGLGGLAAALAGTAPVVAERVISERVAAGSGGLRGSPVRAAGAQPLRAQFYLQAGRDVQLVRLPGARDLRLCNARADGPDPGGRAAGYPIEAAWDGSVAVLAPGACIRRAARRLSVRPAGAIPTGVILTGTLRIGRGAGQQATTPGAPS